MNYNPRRAEGSSRQPAERPRRALPEEAEQFSASSLAQAASPSGFGWVDDTVRLDRRALREYARIKDEERQETRLISRGDWPASRPRGTGSDQEPWTGPIARYRADERSSQQASQRDGQINQPGQPGQPGQQPSGRHGLGATKPVPGHQPGPYDNQPEATPQVPRGKHGQPVSPDDVDQIDQADRKNLGRNSILMASGTLVSRVLGMVNAMLLVRVVGQALAADAFRSANSLPNYILVLLSGGILNAVLLPQITKAMKRPDGGKEFVDRLLTAAFALILGVAVLCTVGAGVLMQVFTRLQGPALHLAIMFAYLCMPQVLFYGVFAVFGNLLNARGSFGPFGWAPVLNNVVAIAGELFFLHLWGQQADPSVWSTEMVWVLAGSATLGIVAQTIILVPVLYRTGFRWTPRWGLRGYGFGQVGRFAGLTFLALCIAQGGGLFIMNVATGMIDRAPEGQYVAGYAAYQNAMTLFQMPYSLIAFSILTALFPQIARAWQRRDESSGGLQDTRDLVYKGLTLPAVGIIPASVVLIALARPIVRGIYWSLEPDQATATAFVLAIMASATISYTIVTLQQQYCFATEQGGTNLWMQCLVTGIQVGFAGLALVVAPSIGIVTICLGMLVGNTTLAIVFVLYARRQMGGLNLAGVLRLYVRLLAASVLGGVPAYFVGSFIVSASADTLLSQYIADIAGAAAFVLGFLVGVKIFHIREFSDFMKPVLRRLGLSHAS